MKSRLYYAKIGKDIFAPAIAFFNTCRFAPLFFILLFSFAPKVIFSQGFCGFDNCLHQSGVTQAYISNMQTLIQEEMSLMNLPASQSSSVNIPVIFHIIHNNGEPVGIGNNIDASVITTAINTLNSDFGNTGIQFCPAQRTPEGEILTEPGIKRVDGSPSGYTGSMSLSGPDESLIKGLSYFTNHRYINIWVVGSIVGGNGTTSGFAYLPNTAPNNLDGIVISNSSLGSSNHVLAHEMGHFLGLLHTFHGDDYDGNETPDGCPNNNPNFTTGDGITETQPHIRSDNSSCPFCASGPNSCDTGSLLEDIVNNYMDYSCQSCMNTFVGEQIDNMHGAINMFRAGLKTSIGCSSGCTQPFNIVLEQNPLNPVSTDAFVNFGATLPWPNSNTEWYVDGILQSGNFDTYTHTFTTEGKHTVCFRATVGNCINEKCIEIIVIPSLLSVCTDLNLPQCEMVYNGDISQNNPTNITNSFGNIITYGPSFIFNPLQVSDFSLICGWYNFTNIPVLAKLINTNNFVLSNADNNERGPLVLSSSYPINFIHNKKYKVSFDLAVTNDQVVPASSFGGYYFGLVNFGDYTNSLNNVPFQHNSVNKIKTYAGNEIDVKNKHFTNLNDSDFNSYSFEFIYQQGMPRYICFSEINAAGYEYSDDGISCFIDNISITECCIPEPQIEVIPIDGCRYQFNFGNSGDPASLYWQIESGPSGTAASTEFTFALPGTYQVCLYATCDDGQVNKEECITVTVGPECTPNCGGIYAPIINLMKWCDEDTYQGNVSIPIDPGFKPCNKDYLYFTPNDNIAFYDYYFDESGATPYLDLSITFNSMPYNNYSLVLCGEDGTSRCFQFGALQNDPIECDQCTEIEEIQVADCIDPDDTDNIFVYGGTINVTPEAGYEPCGSVSTSGGYNQGNPVLEANGSYSIPYTITTNQYGNFNSQLTLCFTDGGVGKQCFKVNISIVDHCILDPSVCLYDSEHTLYCTEVGADEAVFIFDHRFIDYNIFAQGYGLCDEGGISISAGSYEEIEVYSTEAYQHTTLKLTIPCEVIDAEGNIELTLNLCDDANNEFCLLVLLNLDCPGCPENLTENKSSANSYKLYPNPTTSMLMVQAPYSKFNQHISFYDGLGKLVHQQPIQSGQSTIDLSFLHAGIYTTKIENGGDVFIQKVILIK